jgi:hypothetical protein
MTPIRLAIRSEGEFVNAYHAETGTMKGALLLGSIRRTLLRQQPDLFDTWKSLMSKAYSQMIEDALSVKPTMIEEPAPEHERAGRG